MEYAAIGLSSGLCPYRSCGATRAATAGFLTWTCLLLVMVMGFSPRTLAEEPPASVWFEGQKSIELPFAASKLVAGADGQVLAIGDDERSVAVVSLDDGRVLGPSALDAAPVSAAAGPDAGEPGAFALTLPGTGGAYRLVALGATGDDLSVQDLPDTGFSTEFEAPSLTYVLPSPKGPVDEPILLVWDSSPDQTTFTYQLAYGDAVESHSMKLYPSRFIAVSPGPFVLGLNPNRVAIVDIFDGEVVDIISAGGLATDDPARLAVFVPAQAAGGAGSVVLANGEAKLLTVLTLQADPEPQLGPPLQISLDSVPGLAAGDRPVRVASDRDLAYILVGAEGSASVTAFRRGKGSLESIQQIVLRSPLRDLTAVGGPAPTDPEVFAFLSDDGRTLLASDIASLIFPAPGTSEASETVDGPGSGLSVQNRGNVARLQRLLADFGYQVGAIDGHFGRLTEAALRAFQFDRGLDVSGTPDEATIAALEGASAETATAYQAFLDRRIEAVDGSQLLTLGLSQEDPADPCYGLNDLPPHELWPNSVRFANLVRHLASESGLSVQVTSGYRSAVYDRCIPEREGPELGHTAFQAFDVYVADAASADESIGKLTEALGALEAKGMATVEAHALGRGGSVHIAPTIGEWHAVIASYPPGDAGCNYARDDVAEFARLLAGSEAAQREISVVRTARSNHLAVTVDTHGDRGAAERVSELVRQVAGQSGDHRTGANSFVRRNEGWFVDGACAETYVVPDAR